MDVNSIVRSRVMDYIDDNEEVILWDGFDEAIVGVARQFGVPLVVYDRQACIAILIDIGMTLEEAEAHFGDNVEGMYSGKATPLVLEFPDD